MFTILVRHRDGNEEILHGMKNPRLIVNPPVIIAGDRTLNQQGFYAEYTATEGPCAYYPLNGCGDTIFVMNEGGKTVAKYHL